MVSKVVVVSGNLGALVVVRLVNELFDKSSIFVAPFVH